MKEMKVEMQNKMEEMEKRMNERDKFLDKIMNDKHVVEELEEFEKD